VTLAVLVLETSGNTAALRAATYQNVVDSVTRTLDMRVTDPEIERVWRMGLAGEELNDVDKERFRAIITATMRRFENAFYQYELGTIEPKQWEGLSLQVQRIMSNPGTDEWWNLANSRFSPEFRSLVESTRTIGE